MPRVIVTGSRHLTDAQLVQDALAAAIETLGPGFTVVHGAAKGADELANVLAPGLGLTCERWPADWDRLGRSAGPRRNAEMVAAGADLALAFLLDGAPCHGTRDCATKAQRAGIPVRWYIQEAS